MFSRGQLYCRCYLFGQGDLLDEGPHILRQVGLVDAVRLGACDDVNLQQHKLLTYLTHDVVKVHPAHAAAG